VVLVASEATDQISVVRFAPTWGPGGTPQARVVEVRTVGMNPIDPDGPHGLAFAPDGRSYFVSTAHGTPFGSLWQYDTETGRVLGRVMLGSFPATLQVSPDGLAAYVVNFNLHGEMVPSSVSVVALGAAGPVTGAPAGAAMPASAPTPAAGAPEDALIEMARITTCAMPHGSRLSADGARHYSACMMDDLLVEIDARALGVARAFRVTKGREGGAALPTLPAADAHAGHGGAHASGGHGMDPSKPGETACSPTWAQPSADGRTVWVACNRTSDLAEVDVASWTLRRRIPAGDGVYNLAATRDGRLLVATNKRGQSVSVFDAASGRELARIPTLRKVVHGVVISPDDRYAFVSVEGIGSQPGTVEVIDLARRARVASADVGPMAGGIDVRPMR
jgi:DNA-binding beta-propeller fold protein YncE